MDDIFVAQLMTSDPVTVTADTLVEDAAQTLLEEGISSVIVADDDGVLDGILTTTDFVKIVAEQKPKDQTSVSAYMSTDLTTAEAGDPIEDVADKMVEHGFHHMPVVDGNQVVGIITTTDLAAYISQVQSPSP